MGRGMKGERLLISLYTREKSKAWCNPCFKKKSSLIFEIFHRFAPCTELRSNLLSYVRLSMQSFSRPLLVRVRPLGRKNLFQALCELGVPGIDVELVVVDVDIVVDRRAVVVDPGGGGGDRARVRVRRRLVAGVVGREEAVGSLRLARLLDLRQAARRALAEPEVGLNTHTPTPLSRRMLHMFGHVCVCLCLSVTAQVGVLSKLLDASSWVLARRLPFA